ncbi:hypothetical protein DAETH_46600 (plasmid) [Deinococcus aetherius]|uniref:Uncharacterized protein n=1 Tax=Deinococcus aetherius TaxID=200252 RepID=A0ABM8ALH6_9DEIO|nr:DUF1345 domain-containing protein [Deinococcus aetherius]BDP44691.1 hypothetical protein DAETH_46600 [Deinococcus aetherius]
MKGISSFTAHLARPAANARARLVVMSIAGLGVYLLLPDTWPWFLQVLLGWDAAAPVFLVPALWLVVSADAAETRQFATRADPARASARLLPLAASSMSLVGVGRGLAEAGKLGGSLEAVLTVSGLLAVGPLLEHPPYGLHPALCAPVLHGRPGRGGL